MTTEALKPGEDEMLLEAVAGAIKRAMVKGWGYRDLGRAAIKAAAQPTPLAPWTRPEIGEITGLIADALNDLDSADDLPRAIAIAAVKINALYDRPAPTVCPDGWKLVRKGDHDEGC